MTPNRGMSVVRKHTPMPHPSELAIYPSPRATHDEQGLLPILDLNPRVLAIQSIFMITFLETEAIAQTYQYDYAKSLTLSRSCNP